jgi:hypothetical protein
MQAVLQKIWGSVLACKLVILEIIRRAIEVIGADGHQSGDGAG